MLNGVHSGGHCGSDAVSAMGMCGYRQPESVRLVDCGTQLSGAELGFPHRWSGRSELPARGHQFHPVSAAACVAAHHRPNLILTVHLTAQEMTMPARDG
jgi:hypothetical protein